MLGKPTATMNNHKAMPKDNNGNKTALDLAMKGKITTKDAATETTFQMPKEPEALRLDQAKLIKTRDPNTKYFRPNVKVGFS